MFKACQRIMDAVLSNARPLRFVVLVTDATRGCMDLLLCGHQKHPSIIAPLFHITDARVPTYNADAMTTKLCSHIHGFLLQSHCAFNTDPVDNHDVVRMLGQTLELKYKTKLCHTPLHLQPSSKKVLSTIWKSAWEDECITRKHALDASPRDWGAIFESFDRINQLLPLCNAKWIRHILRFCNPRGCCARVSVFEPVIGCYMVFSMETAEVYIGMVGQTAVRLFGVRWNSNGSASIGRPISDRGREHILAMLKCASGRSNAHAMYRYMSRIAAHRWGICPLELCSIFRVFSREQWWQRHAIKLLNSRLPQFSSKDWAKLGRGKLYPPTVLSMTDSTTVEKEVSCLRSSLSLEQQFSILHESQGTVEHRLWERLFRKVKARTRRECGIVLRRFLLLKIKNTSAAFADFVQQRMRQHLLDSKCFTPLKSFYADRIKVVRCKTKKVADWVLNSQFRFTPGLLQRCLEQGCACVESPLCCPPPISHIVSRSTCEHLQLILGDSAGLLRQNAQNSTVAPLLSCVNGLSSSVYSTMRQLPGVPEHEAMSASRSMAEAAFHAYDDEITSVDPRVNPEHLQTLRQQDHNFRFLLADKNPGLLFVVCTVHWAQLFQAHILQNVKYQVLHAFGAVFLARNLLRNTIIERMYSSGLIQTWRPILGARWKPPSKHSRAPSAKILIKSKSQEADGILKIRFVISHFSHPASKIGKLASRALSLLCRLVGDMDINFEIFSMYDAKGLFVSALSAADKDSVPWAGLELDMVDMYSEIPKDRVLDSVMYCVSVLRDKRKSRNPITWFAISTICKSLDRLGTGTSRDFMNLSIEMITSFVNFELWANADFTAGGYVLSQLIGLPMGGPISAQLAVLYLMSAEMRATRSALSVHKFIHGRYRDNFYIFGPKSVLFDLQQTMKVQLESTYAMPITVEQFGTKVQVLEVIVDFDSQSRGLRLNSRALDVHTGAVSGVVRWPDRWSTNMTVWRSLVPGLCVKCEYWSWSHGDIYEKVVLIVAESGYKDVPRRHWQTRVLNFCKENQIPVGPSDLMVMYEYGNFLRWG